MRAGVLILLIGLLGACAPMAQNAEEVAVGLDDAENEPDKPIYVPEMANSFEIQWPTRFSRNDAIHSAQSKSYRFFETALKKECNHSAVFYWQRAVDAQAEIELIGQSLVKIFCEELGADLPVIVGDYEFLQQTLVEQQLESDEFGGICGVPNDAQTHEGCALFGTGWFRGDLSNNKLRELVAHELFHVVQDAMSPEPDGTRIPLDHPQRVPNWLTEGSATFFEATFNDFLIDQNTWNYWDYAVLPAQLMPGSRLSIDLSGMETDYSGNTYNLGAFASEYLVANTSFESLLGVWHLRDEGYSFEEAFLLTFGISLQQFYETVASIEIQAEQ